MLLLVNIAVWRLLLNGVWEFAQCVLFYDMRSVRFWPGVAFMLLAVAGDVLIVLALCWLTVIVRGNTFSYRGLSRGTITLWLLLLSVSLAVAVALEYGAVHLGLWRYSERMLTARIGGEQVGLAPVLQMTLLPALSLWMAAYLPVFRRRRSK